MKYYHLRELACLTACVLSLVCAGCGGSKGQGISLEPAGNPSVQSGTEARYTGSYRMIEGTLKAEPQYTYDAKSYPTLDGCSVVPMDASLQPVSEERERFSISRVETDRSDKRRIYSLQSSGTAALASHFRFDPGMWELDGIISRNAWGTEDFIAIAVEEAPGVLAINSLPTGPGAESAKASGEFAQMILRPTGTRAAKALSTDTSVGVIWSATKNLITGFPSIQSSGSINYRLDGLIGDVSSKDGDITGAELTASSADLLLHPMIHGAIDSSFADGDLFASPSLTFNENLVGDYDNNGEVNISDITPIAQHMNTGGDDTYSARRGVYETTGGSWFNVKNMIEDSRWTSATHSLNVFWYLDQEGWTDPTAYEHSSSGTSTMPKTALADAIDGNWDGFVLDWKNYDGNNDDEYEAYYDTPTSSRPGDVGPLNNHIGERITGYQVYTIPQNSSNYSYSSGTPAIPSNPDSMYYETIIAENFHRGGTYDDYVIPPISPTPILYTKPYHLTEQGTDKRMKSEVTCEFTAADFWDTQPAADTTYDILIYPYYYDAGTSTMYRGPASRVIGAFTFQLDTYGPQYTAGIDDPDDDSSGNGLQAISQQGQYTLNFVYDNADDVVPADAGDGHRWATSSESKNVRYQLYGSTTEGSVFSNLLTGKSWVEGDDTQGTSDRRSMTVTFTAQEVSNFGLNFTAGQTTYFGIRASEEDGSPLAEYAPGGSGNYTVNTTTKGWMFVGSSSFDFGPQYLDGSNPPPGSSSGRGINAVAQKAQTIIEINYDDADDVDPDGSGNPTWGSSNVSYRLYASTTDTGSALFTTANWIAAGSQEWDETQDVSSAGGTRIMEFSFDLENPLLPLNDSGGEIHFGIRCREYTGEPLAEEYAGVTTPTNHYVTLTVADMSPPIFVYPESAANSGLSEAPDFLRQSYSYDGEVAVYFWPALDPPEYSGTDTITYHCYWSLATFTIEDIGVDEDVHEVSSPLSFTFDSKYDPENEYPPFDIETLVYILDNGGSSLSDGQYIYFIIRAEDDEENFSENSTIHRDAARDVDNTEAITLVSGLPHGAADNPGDIQSDKNDVYVTYPSAWVDPNSQVEFDETIEVDYRRLHGGATSPSDIDTDVLSGAAYEPGSPGSHQLSMTHQVNVNGTAKLDSNSERMPIIAYNGLDFSGTISNFDYYLQVMSSTRSSSGTWGTHTFHDQSLSDGWEWSGGATIYPVIYDNGSGLTTTYLLSWTNMQISGNPVNELRFKTSSNPDSWGSAFTVLDTWAYRWNTDQIPRSSYNLVTGSTITQLSQLSTAPSRVTYMAVSNPTISSRGITFPPKLDVWKTEDTSEWEQFDIAGNLPDLQTNATVVGNGFELVVDPINTQHILYAAYFNNPSGEEASDSNGLRIAYAIDGGSGPGQWSSPSSAGLIDGSAYMPEFVYFDKVDLRVKPDYVASTHLFEGLGCSYIDQKGYLYCAETVGNSTNATWGYQTVGGLDQLEEGRILWVKMAYFNDGTTTDPYLLYAVQTSSTGGYSIKLWRPGGF
jgi:hypothetical protein